MNNAFVYYIWSSGLPSHVTMIFNMILDDAVPVHVEFYYQYIAWYVGV